MRRAGFVAAARDQPALVTLSIVGTSDLHGAALPSNGLGGLALLAGYVNNLRAARASDGGAVLLIDSGDTFQGDVESNLSEGALIVDAYNAMGYTAEAIGNHDFDFGSVDSPAARQLPGDLRGALKARAAQARYPFLAANLIDEATGRPVEWPNVGRRCWSRRPAIKVGIVGVMTIDALQSTLAANVQGLRIAPLAPAIAAEASKLRAAGAEVVIVAAHAGGRCERFDQPADLSSCDADVGDLSGREKPAARAGRRHRRRPHARRARASGQRHRHHPAVLARPGVRPRRHRLRSADADASRGCSRSRRSRSCRRQYEGTEPSRSDPAIGAGDGAGAPARARAAGDAARRLARCADSARRHRRIAAGKSVRGGAPRGAPARTSRRSTTRRAACAPISPDGPLTLGRLYDVFPFDNRIARITLSGAELGRWVAAEIQQGRRGGLGISGVEVRTSCHADGLHVDLFRGHDRFTTTIDWSR